jgi:hypothetical protein
MLTFENATTLPSGGRWTGDGESAAAGHSSHNRSSSTSPCFFQFCCLLVCLLREAAVHGKVVVPRGMRLKNQLAHSPTLAHTRSRARARAHTHTHTHTITRRTALLQQVGTLGGADIKGPEKRAFRRHVPAILLSPSTRPTITLPRLVWHAA